MANSIYASYKEAALGADFGLDSANIKVILVDLADYTFSAAHNFLDDVPAAARVATSPNLGSKTITGGVFDAADTSFPTVTGDVSEAIIVYEDSGAEGTSHLIAFFDTGITGIPITPNGNDIDLLWNGSGIFAL